MTHKVQIDNFKEESSTTPPFDQSDQILIPYLQRGDSNRYIDQFLSKMKEPSKTKPSHQDSDQSEIVLSSFSSPNDIAHSQDKEGGNKSAFHNFQKHLSVSLKKSIEIISQQKSTKDYQIVGAKLWKTFKTSKISTKKILHYILGMQNEHRITESCLRQYNLTQIYDQTDQSLMKQAKNFLAQQTIRQIKEGKLNDYLSSKKLKDMQQFKKYVEIFVEELQQGYLKKKLSKEKVIELQNYQ